MEIKHLKPRQSKVDIEVEIIAKGDIREFDKFGAKGRVCTATAKDTSGEIKLTLWNDDIEKVNIGDKVKITNGYVNEFQGEKQLTPGRFGKLEVMDKDSHKTPNKEKVSAELKKETEELEEGPTEEEITEDEEQESEL